MASEKQLLFMEYLLQQIGFADKEKIDKYIGNIFKIYGERSPFFNYKNEIAGWYINISKGINSLIDEVNIKKAWYEIKTIPLQSKLHSASDMSNYIFCPASYSIRKSFVIEKPSQEEAGETGSLLHSAIRLANKGTSNFSRIIQYDEKENLLIKEIKNSEIIYCGHVEGSKNFINESENFIGQPDYIFRDKEGYCFIVEEKFHKIFVEENHSGEYDENGYWSDTSERNRNVKNFKPFFYKNHEMQLVSYIRNVVEFEIKYGYLIYWYYQFLDGIPWVSDVAIKKIELTDSYLKSYVDTIKGIENLNSSKQIEFNPQDININKCSACVVNKYCGHKVGKFNSISFPYNPSDLRLYPVKFPEQLRKPVSPSEES